MIIFPVIHFCSYIHYTVNPQLQDKTMINLTAPFEMSSLIETSFMLQCESVTTLGVFEYLAIDLQTPDAVHIYETDSSKQQVIISTHSSPHFVILPTAKLGTKAIYGVELSSSFKFVCRHLPNFSGELYRKSASNSALFHLWRAGQQ